ncbi:hypothetical protein EC988_004582 [Linderina pennispora]|nr:hypothetical protein EC988_004582 [Linderina pennispora]
MLFEQTSAAGAFSHIAQPSGTTSVSTPLLASYSEQTTTAALLSGGSSTSPFLHTLSHQQPSLNCISPADLLLSISAATSAPGSTNLQVYSVPSISVSASDELQLSARDLVPYRSAGIQVPHGSEAMVPLNMPSNLLYLNELPGSQDAGSQVIANDLFANNGVLTTMSWEQPSPVQPATASPHEFSVTGDESNFAELNIQTDVADSQLSDQFGWLQRGTIPLLTPQVGQATGHFYPRINISHSPRSLPSFSPALTDTHISPSPGLLSPMAASTAIAHYHLPRENAGHTAVPVADTIRADNGILLSRAAGILQGVRPTQSGQPETQTVDPQALTASSLSVAWNADLSVPRSPLFGGTPATHGSPLFALAPAATTNAQSIQLLEAGFGDALINAQASVEDNTGRTVAGQPIRHTFLGEGRRKNLVARDEGADNTPYSDGQQSSSRHMTTPKQRKAYYKWIIANIHHPYPEDHINGELNIDNQRMSQFRYWFANTRRRQMMLIGGNRYSGVWAIRPAFERACRRVGIRIPDHIKRVPNDL